MPAIAIVLVGLSAIVGVGFIVKEVHDITETPAFPMVAAAGLLVAIIAIAKFARE